MNDASSSPWARALGTLIVCVAVVGLCDLGLRAAGAPRLAERVVRIQAWVRWRASPDPRLVRVASGCPRMRVRPGWDDGEATPRDALGRRVLGAAEGAPTVLVVGDSVPAGGLADELAAAAEAAGRSLRIVDATLPDYAFDDQRCTASEGAALPGIIGIIGSIVANDVPIPPVVRLDLGGGEALYDWASVVQRPVDQLEAVPLLLDGSASWVGRNLATLRARWGEAVVVDVAAPDALRPYLESLPPPRDDTPGRRLADALAETSVPAVVLAYPMLHRIRPHAVDALIDRGIAELVGSGVPVVDLRDVVGPFSHDELAVRMGAQGGPERFDPLHLGRAGLALAAEAALARLDLLPAVRAALRTRAVDGLGGGVSCEPVVVDAAPVSVPAPGCRVAARP